MVLDKFLMTADVLCASSPKTVVLKKNQSALRSFHKIKCSSINTFLKYVFMPKIWAFFRKKMGSTVGLDGPCPEQNRPCQASD